MFSVKSINVNFLLTNPPPPKCLLTFFLLCAREGWVMTNVAMFDILYAVGLWTLCWSCASQLDPLSVRAWGAGALGGLALFYLFLP